MNIQYTLILISSLTIVSVVSVYEEPKDPVNQYKDIEILTLESAVDQDGGYSFRFENDDGSRVYQEGQHKIINDEHSGETIRGSYSYNDEKGHPVSLTYTADENGFVPFGAHLPTPPPTPPEILRSLRFLATAKPFVDEELYDYKPKKKVFRGRLYRNRNGVTRPRNNLRSISNDTSVDGFQNSSTENNKKTENNENRQSATAVINESKKNINDALKETIEKTSKITHSATDETASAAVTAVREEAAKLTEKVKLEISQLKEKLSAAGDAGTPKES